MKGIIHVVLTLASSALAFAPTHYYYVYTNPSCTRASLSPPLHDAPVQSTARGTKAASLTTTALNAAAHSRRSFASIAGTTAAMLLLSSHPQPALAIPMITTDEFLTILRDSARSIRVVEFSGPLSETVTVQLVDGTAFGINDVVESSTDPRSPLKISAACRQNQVPAKFTNIDAILANAPKKKKIYANERVQIAGEKEKEKAARMAQDEENRLAELYRLETTAAK